MTIVDVCKILYPTQVELENIQFGQDEPNSPIQIKHWAVDGVEQPSEEYLLSLIPQYEQEIKLNYFVTYGALYLRHYLDEVAQQKQYDNAASLAGYLYSSVTQWSEESRAFLDWRDAVFVYVMQETQKMENAEREIPDFEAFKQELPVILWP